ncbi:phosphotransferase-like protein [Niveomyces insectorum RCEF 264]|uniref:Phosphotransferase-like protein n=1 Tax=Niveomyces insectorum RCEF 264 TaxID=1081102 RepID=A0A167Z7C1_9HYPO|nr:phosphotransferase-like protein [Niveomyces insectorum RCEF 264]
MSSDKDANDRIKELEAQLKKSQGVTEKERAEKEKTQQQLTNTKQQLTNTKQQLTNTKQQLANSTFSDFLRFCHERVFLNIKIERNSLLSTGGGVTRVHGKQYPRRLAPWTEFHALHQASYDHLAQAFQQQRLFPSTAGLSYLVSKLRDQKLASEEDLKTFECLAVEGCALDVLPHFLRLAADGTTTYPNGNPPLSISFNNYPFGVVARESDEESDESEIEKDEQKQEQKQKQKQKQPRRGRSRKRDDKPFMTKDDRPAYMSALAVAKHDMDAAVLHAVTAEEQRDKSGPPRKRRSLGRTKVRPDQWCFRHGQDGTMRPLFVVEYKAAHKINGELLRSYLMPDAAASLMENAIRVANKEYSSKDLGDDSVAMRDVGQILTQAFHYMVDYGLQFSYVTTGYAFIFLYLDPDQPSTLFYHLAEPKTAVNPKDDGTLRYSAVALLVSFVVMSARGGHMSQGWKKHVRKTLPTWPKPYEDMKDIPAFSPDKKALRTTTEVVLVAKQTIETCKDPRKQGSTRRRDADDDDDPQPRPGPAGGAPSSSGTTRKTLASTTTMNSPSTKHTSDSNSTKGSQQQQQQQQQQTEPSTLGWTWAQSFEKPSMTTRSYCTQACLLGLKRGGNKDPRCPNVGLHRRHNNNNNTRDDRRHPISAEQLRTQLVQQLAEDLDNDCENLERDGMYGATGALFKLVLSQYGYCFVGKGVQRAHRKRLAKEALAYGFLEACQGRLVPVELGMIELADEYWTQCGAHISHMMLMSFAGHSLWHHARQAQDAEQTLLLYETETRRTLCELKQYGLVHGDVNNNNMVWNEELQRVLAIDFDHSFVTERHPEKHKAEAEEEDQKCGVQPVKRVKTAV